MNTYELLHLSANGDNKAKEKLIEDNLGLIYIVINRFKDRGYEQEDLFQIAAIGLLKSIENFNPDYGLKFSTYAVPMMIGEIKRFLRDDSVMKVSRYYKLLAGKAASARESILLKTGKEPTLSEISDFLQVEPEELAAALAAVRPLESLDSPLTDSENTLADVVADPHNPYNSILLKQIIQILPEREQKILIWRYFKEETQAEIAKKLGLSQVQISRIEKNILFKLRQELQA